MNLKYTGLLLAGGEGSRMGGYKPLCILGGKSFFERSLQNLYQNVQQVTISVAQRDQQKMIMQNHPAATQLSFVLDNQSAIKHLPTECGGPLLAIASGLQYLAQQYKHQNLWVLVAPCDAPFISFPLLDALVNRIETSKQGYELAYVSHCGEKHYTIGLFRATGYEDMFKYLSQGKFSLKGYFETVKVLEVNLDNAQNISPLSFMNLNTPQDVLAAEKKLADETV